MFAIAFLAFVVGGNFIFGTTMQSYSSFTDSTFTLLRLILGDFDFPSMQARLNIRMFCKVLKICIATSTEKACCQMFNMLFCQSFTCAKRGLDSILIRGIMFVCTIKRITIYVQ
jgi:hypothetical protein